jgi:hypothetical protein
MLIWALLYMKPLTLDAAEVAFLAARLRHLFAHFEIPVPGSDDDARLIGNAGAAIGMLLSCPRATREFPYVGRPNFDGLRRGEAVTRDTNPTTQGEPK